jgi:hypothetical protein
MKIRIKVPVLMIITACIFLLGGSDGSVNPGADTALYQSFLEMRKVHGLDMSDESMKKVMAMDPPGPFTIEEREMLKAWSEVKDQIPSLQSYLQYGQAAHFGGLYIKDGQGKIVVQLVDGTPEIEEEIKKRFSSPDRLIFEQVQFTESELNQARAILEAKMGEIEHFSGLGTNVFNNRVSVMFNKSREEVQESIVQIEELVNPEIVEYRFGMQIRLLNN